MPEEIELQDFNVDKNVDENINEELSEEEIIKAEKIARYKAGRQAYKAGNWLDKFDRLTYSEGDSIADQIRNTKRRMWKQNFWNGTKDFFGVKNSGQATFQKFDLPINYASQALQPNQEELSDEEKAKIEAEEKAKQEQAREANALNKAQHSLISSGTGPMVQGFQMPYTAGFGAPGPSIADRFSFAGNKTIEGAELTNTDAVEVGGEGATI